MLYSARGVRSGERLLCAFEGATVIDEFEAGIPAGEERKS